MKVFSCQNILVFCVFVALSSCLVIVNVSNENFGVCIMTWMTICIYLHVFTCIYLHVFYVIFSCIKNQSTSNATLYWLWKGQKASVICGKMYKCSIYSIYATYDCINMLIVAHAMSTNYIMCYHIKSFQASFSNFTLKNTRMKLPQDRSFIEICIKVVKSTLWNCFKTWLNRHLQNSLMQANLNI